MKIRRCLPLIISAAALQFAVGCGADAGAEEETGGSGGSDTGGSGAGDASPWMGKTFALGAVPEGKWSSPDSQNVKADLSAYVPNFLIQVTGGTAAAPEVVIASGDSTNAQRVCGATTATATTSAYPGINIGPADLQIQIQHADPDIPLQVNPTLRGLTLTNILPDVTAGTPATMGMLSATLDIREIFPLFTLLISPTAEGVCSSLEDEGAPCQPCGDGQPFCLTTEAILLGATEIPGATITPTDASVFSTVAECAEVLDD